MALNSEGFPVSVWDDWSRKDMGRYHAGDCDKKYQTFKGAGTTVGTIFHIAERFGYKPHGKVYSWDDFIPAEVEGMDYYEEVLTKEAKEEEPYQMAIRYLETLFRSDETISYVHSAKYDEKRDKWIPADAGHVRKVSAIIRDLKRYKRLDEAFGTINPAAGAWIRHNPTTGPNNKDVTRFEHVLVESDSMPLDEQKAFLVNQRLPIAALLESGGKSIHAIVKIQAENENEYKQRVNFLFDYLSKHSFQVDEANKNSARLSRMPGAERNGNIQKLVAVNIGCGSYLEWIDMINGIDDDLPPLVSFWDQTRNPPELSPELISGVLREGNKMIITGDSKAGKTCMSQNLAVCIAEGRPWLNKFQCQQGSVLYINLEVEAASLYYRFCEIYKALGIKITETSSNLQVWNLRGHAVPLDELAKKLISRCRNAGPYKAIFLDPLYKVQQGDENSAEAIIKFCNALDQIAHETGAAVIYDHHHPKGEAGARKVTDRGAGSGVFARDADAICDLTNLIPGNEASDLVKELCEKNDRPMELSFVLRDFRDIPSIKVWFKFPLHVIDSAGLLENCYAEGSKLSSLHQNKNYKSEDEKKRIVDYAFGVCQEQGYAKLSDMLEYSEVKEKTLRKYVNEVDGYELNHGIVRKV